MVDMWSATLVSSAMRCEKRLQRRLTSATRSAISYMPLRRPQLSIAEVQAAILMITESSTHRLIVACAFLSFFSHSWMAVVSAAVGARGSTAMGLGAVPLTTPQMLCSYIQSLTQIFHIFQFSEPVSAVICSCGGGGAEVAI